MGLHVSSLEHIPPNAKRDYFIYLLDYGWSEPLRDVLKQNYDRMAELAAENDAVVIRGTRSVHFEDEVFSWHNINGENAEELLPAILITNRHPLKFKESFNEKQSPPPESDLKFILLPLKKFCSSTSDVIVLIEKVFKDIKAKKDLSDFQVAEEKKKGIGRAVASSIILEPNFYGIGFSFKQLTEYFKGKAS